jgi:uncharacterized membrane protein
MRKTPLVTSLVQRNKSVARRKGVVASAATGGAVVAAVAIGPVVGVIALGAAGYFAWDWLSFRVKNGLRF